MHTAGRAGLGVQGWASGRAGFAGPGVCAGYTTHRTDTRCGATWGLSGAVLQGGMCGFKWVWGVFYALFRFWGWEIEKVAA